MKTYLAMRDKSTNEVRLVEANVSILGPVVDVPETANVLLMGEKVKKIFLNIFSVFKKLIVFRSLDFNFKRHLLCKNM